MKTIPERELRNRVSRVLRQVEAGERPPALDRKLPIPEEWSMLVERAQQPPPRDMALVDLQQMQQQQ